jgi:hypothetical protein
VMLGDPIATIAVRFSMLREIARIGKRLRGSATFNDGREIENGERDHAVHECSGNKKPGAKPGYSSEAKNRITLRFLRAFVSSP